MTALTRTRQLIEQSADQISDASRASFLGVITMFEAGQLGRSDAMLQLQLATMGPAAATNGQKMNEIIASFESESSGN
jgi:hypothetical protein